MLEENERLDEESRKKSRENYYKNRQTVLIRQKDIRRSNNELLYKTVGGAFCRLCGFHKHTCSLQLHHLDSSQKDNHKDVLSNWIKIPNQAKFIEKLKSVDFTILCANCHVAVHVGELSDSELKPLEIM